ncbi:MAG: malto-oligosyltrehalose synthase [Thermomicrobiales bacterium]
MLSGDEELPTEWPVNGTTGYDFLNMAGGVLSSTVGLADLVEMTRRYAAEEADFAELLNQAKHQVIEELFSADANRLRGFLAGIARHDRYGRDLIDEELDAAIQEVTVCLPVYRTYIDGLDIRPADRSLVEGAVSRATERRPDLNPALRLLSRVLLLEDADHLSEAETRARLDFIAAWQQFTGPVMAKGLEDTTLYRDPTLLSANAVGGERELAEVSVRDFHSWLQNRFESWPLAMNATSTHDSKRSEDVRARIAVLSEVPDQWETAFEQLREASAADVRSVDDHPVPDGRAALMLFQTMLGSWPLDDSELPGYLERIQSYAIKAEREAKLRTTWIDQNMVYEEAFQGFIADVLENERFLDAFQEFQNEIAFHGMLNSLSATLMKMTAPGIPDFYQGTEIWDFSLVDPDNRRPVDYDKRRALLDQISSDATPTSLLGDWKSGAIKLFLIQRALRTRSEFRPLFEQGRYVPLDVQGDRAGNVIAFARVLDGRWAVTVVPRLTARMARESGEPLGQFPLGAGPWSDTRINLPGDAPSSWEQPLLSEQLDTEDGSILLADAFRQLPVALLTGTT